MILLQAVELVSQKIEKMHRLVFHGIDETDAVDELAIPAYQGIVKAREIFGRDCHVGVQDHQYIALCLDESQTHGIAFPFPRLTVQLVKPTFSGVIRYAS